MKIAAALVAGALVTVTQTPASPKLSGAVEPSVRVDEPRAGMVGGAGNGAPTD